MGYLDMKNKTIIKNKKSFSRREKSNIVLTVIFSLISLGLGFIVAFWGNGNSFVETDLITAIITLFGFGLTATVFVCQAFEKNTKETKNIITSLSKTLLLTLCLVIVTLILDFIASLITAEVWNVIIETLKYAALIYSLICQFDILSCFIVIISNKKDDSKKDE